MSLSSRTLSFIGDADAGSFFRSDWPEAQQFGFLECCDLFEFVSEKESILQRIAYLRQIEEIRIPPIIGVVGGKNAGKSSFVGGFLSNSGRERVLSGEEFKAGTQRFVLWLPSLFEKEEEVLKAIDQVLSDVFGHPSEALPTGRDKAHAAYAQRGLIDRPLVAFDPGLNDLGFCLLDTPDFQTSENPDDPTPTAYRRFEWIQKCARLIQGVVFIVSRSEIGNESFSVPQDFISSEVESFPRYLCLNKIRKPRSGLLEDEDVRSAVDRLKSTATFGAFDVTTQVAPLWDY